MVLFSNQSHTIRMELVQHNPTNQQTQNLEQPNQLVQFTQQLPPPETLTDFASFGVARLTCTPAERKTIPGTGQEATPPSPAQYYYQIQLMYNFSADPEKPILNELIMEGCEMESKFGIQSKPAQNGRMEHSIMTSFDMNNTDQSRFVETIGQIHGGCAYILQAMKGTVKMPNFNAQQAVATGLKNPIYRPYDEVTGDPIPGRAPSMFFKLFSRGKPPMVEQTLFTGLDAKPIPWGLLQGVEIKFIPLIHVKRIYVGGGKASVQMEVLSAIITSVRTRNTATRQTGTIQRLQQNRPQLLDQVAAQIAKITADRQDQLLGVTQAQPPPQEGGDQTGAQPTFTGIVPTGQRQITQGGQQQQAQYNAQQQQQQQAQYNAQQQPQPQYNAQQQQQQQPQYNTQPPYAVQQQQQPPYAAQPQMAQINPQQFNQGGLVLPQVPPMIGTNMQDFTAAAPPRPAIPLTGIPTAPGTIQLS